MNRLASRIRRLERCMPDPMRPRVIPFPIDGLSEEEIEQEIMCRRGREPMSEEEFYRVHEVEIAGR